MSTPDAKAKIDKVHIYSETAGLVGWKPGDPHTWFVSTGEPGGQRFASLDEAKVFTLTIADSYEVHL